ncbi:MAG: hypothetical protein HC905_16020 [Bacteroidales bacterium]|nr:hypothetical protein [Bacteroidales bacterium]
MNANKKKFYFPAIIFNLYYFCCGQDNPPLPNWDFYVGDSIVASSNSQVQNISRPIIYYNLNDTGKALKCILKTFYKTKPQDYHRTSYLFDIFQ